MPGESRLHLEESIVMFRLILEKKLLDISFVVTSVYLFLLGFNGSAFLFELHPQLNHL